MPGCSRECSVVCPRALPPRRTQVPETGSDLRRRDPGHGDSRSSRSALPQAPAQLAPLQTGAGPGPGGHRGVCGGVCVAVWEPGLSGGPGILASSPLELTQHPRDTGSGGPCSPSRSTWGVSASETVSIRASSLVAGWHVTFQVDATSPRNACCSWQSASGPWVASPVGTWRPASPRRCLPGALWPSACPWAAPSLTSGCRGSCRHLLGPEGLSFFEEPFLKGGFQALRGAVSLGGFLGVGFVLGVPPPSVRQGWPEPPGRRLGCRSQVWWGGASQDGARPQVCTVAREPPSTLGTQNPQ